MIINKILNYLFKSEENYLRKQEDTIVNQHIELLNIPKNKPVNVYHEGYMICNYHNSESTVTASVPVHIMAEDSLKEAYMAYIEQKNNLEKDRHIITAYIKRILNASNTLFDLHALLPEKIYYQVLNPPIGRAKSSESLSDEEISEFKRKNEPFEKLLSQRLILTLIMD